ncbi:MAG: aminotransferase class I/II-fold pyridoxal phosphate-dependent enzyme [Myxococcota bacterium]
MSEALDRLQEELAEGLRARREAGLYREPELPDGVDLTSNDYLGYADDPTLAAAAADTLTTHGAGAGASRLLRGHTPLAEELEARLADLSGREAALLFSSGYQANAGVIPALVGRGDVVFSDALNHASLIDGIRLSRAERVVIPHQDLDFLERALKRTEGRRRLVVTESIFSMDGDLTPLEDVCELAERHGAVVMVDEAHSTGLYGGRGSGRVEALGLSDRVLCTMHTGGKALGVGGAWVAADRVVVEHLINHCRSFIYSTAPVTGLVAGLLAALDRLAWDEETVRDLHRKADRLRRRLRRADLDLLDSESAIVPVVLGATERTMAVARSLREAGFDVRGVRPPTVPQGAARLRVTVRAPVPEPDLDRFADVLLDVLHRDGETAA